MMVGIALCAGVLGAFLNIRHYERQRRREAEHVGGAEGQVKDSASKRDRKTECVCVSVLERNRVSEAISYCKAQVFFF